MIDNDDDDDDEDDDGDGDGDDENDDDDDEYKRSNACCWPNETSTVAIMGFAYFSIVIDVQLNTIPTIGITQIHHQ